MTKDCRLGGDSRNAISRGVKIGNGDGGDERQRRWGLLSGCVVDSSTATLSCYTSAGGGPAAEGRRVELGRVGSVDQDPTPRRRKRK